jgi:small nuclear ribonucleoprotein (snRNP)-like protein
MRVHSVPVNTGPSGGSIGDGDGDGGDVERFAADVRVDLEVQARRRERWIRQRLAEEATLAGALAASLGREVALQVVTGDRIAGELVQVGADVVEVVRRQLTVWVATDAIAALEVSASVPAAGPATSGVSMLEVLTDLSGERSEVVLTLVGGTVLRGELVAVGDVATVRTGPGGRTAYASLAAVAFASVLA